MFYHLFIFWYVLDPTLIVSFYNFGMIFLLYSNVSYLQNFVFTTVCNFSRTWEVLFDLGICSRSCLCDYGNQSRLWLFFSINKEFSKSTCHQQAIMFTKGVCNYSKMYFSSSKVSNFVNFAINKQAFDSRLQVSKITHVSKD